MVETLVNHVRVFKNYTFFNIFHLCEIVFEHSLSLTHGSDCLPARVYMTQMAMHWQWCRLECFVTFILAFNQHLIPFIKKWFKCCSSLSLNPLMYIVCSSSEHTICHRSLGCPYEQKCVQCCNTRRFWIWSYKQTLR